MRPHAHRFWTGFFRILLFIGAVALVRDTRYQGQDFEVFWRGVRLVLAGQPLYDLGRDGAMVFKYPPWFLPGFVPWAMLPLEWAKWAWGLTEVVSLVSIYRWCVGAGATGVARRGVLLAFWGIWAVHCLDGQVSLPLVALLLWGRDRWVLSAWALSAKVTGLVALFGARRPAWRSILFVGPAFAALSLPALLAEPSRSPQGLILSWRSAAASGGELLGHEKVRGRENQGLPALVLRAAKVPVQNSRADAAVSLVIAVLVAAIWKGCSSRLNGNERWAGWLAIMPLISPLSWAHGFVAAFPLMVLSVSAAHQSGRAVPRALVGVGVFLTAVLSQKVFGTWIEPIELLSARAWGVILAGSALVIARGVFLVSETGQGST